MGLYQTFSPIYRVYVSPRWPDAHFNPKTFDSAGKDQANTEEPSKRPAVARKASGYPTQDLIQIQPQMLLG